MINIEFSTNEGFALLKCMNYLVASLQDIDSIEDEQKKKDIELDYYRAIVGMQGIKDEDMIGMINKLEELRVALVAEGEELEVVDLGVIEIVEDQQPSPT